MSFDDVLQPRRATSEDDRKPPRSSPSSQPSSSQSKSILSDVDINEWSKNMGLSDDLTQQVIIPLVAILDKHGGKVLDTQSREIQAASSLASSLTDFLPLLQGAYRYFSGVRKELNEADAALLDAHSAALSATELSNLFGADDEMVVENEPAEEKQPPQTTNTFGPDGFNPPKASNQIIASGKVDYYQLMGYGSEEQFNNDMGEMTTTPDTIYSAQQERLETQVEQRAKKDLPEKKNEVVAVDTLTLEQGMTPYDVEASDTRTKIDKGIVMDGVEITQQRVADDINEINKLMAQERLKMKTSSKMAVETPEMTAEEIIQDMKDKAKPGKGSQRIGEPPNKGGSNISISDEELMGLASNAFAIPGLAELQQAEASQLKASSKMDSTANELQTTADEGVSSATQSELTPISWDEAVLDGSIASAEITEENDE